MATADASIRAFCAQQREWLELELQSEQQQQQDQQPQAVSSSSTSPEGRSHVLHQLQAAEVSVGLYGRTVVRLVSAVAANAAAAVALQLLPAHRFTTGDEVEIRIRNTTGGKSSASGVVSEVTESSLSVALFPAKHKQGKSEEEDDENDFFGSAPLSLIPRSNVEVHRKLLAALTELETKGVDHPVSGRVVQALFDPTSQMQQFSSSNSTTTIQPFNTNLDASQLEAIAFALTANQPIALIHGPVSRLLVVVLCRQTAVSLSHCCYIASHNHFYINNNNSLERGKQRLSWNSFSRRSMYMDGRYW
jgi:hypothetical protein